jgi:hypothetical protein
LFCTMRRTGGFFRGDCIQSGFFCGR